MDWFGKSSMFSSLGSPAGAVTAATVIIIFLGIMLILKISKRSVIGLANSFFNWLFKIFGRFISNKERKYYRDLTIGRINEKRKRVKIYRFLNDLIIDLGLKQKGATPYEFLFIVGVLTLMGDIVVCELLFGSILIAPLMFPILLCGVMCILYTRANIAHDRRIEAIIEAENIICNGITSGVMVAVKENINVIPREVRTEFRDFIDNVEVKNYHIKTALQELNSNLGSTADDFIKKCIVFETEEEHGIAGMFKDVVEVNNIRVEMRIYMKRKFEEVVHNFLIGGSMIFIFLFGVIAIFEDVRAFYFNTIIGNLIICLDILVLISEFVYITYLRAKDI